jgi:NAD(P)-dependent dehydrogenase (short-subunit alcohol dehydrogenase family)
MNVNGVDVVVTGGASGLGAATSRALANAGARVTVFDRNAELGRAVAAEIAGTFFEVDVADGPSVEAAMADLSNVVRVNLIGTFNCIRLAAWKMHTLSPSSEGERGVIVTTSSIAAFDGVDGGSAYSASKGGVAAMTLPLARDLGRYGVRVVSIAPGPFGTPLTENMPNDYNTKLIAESPFPHRMGKPEEYASLALHLIDNPMINGEVIRIDAAMRMAPNTFR